MQPFLPGFERICKETHNLFLALLPDNAAGHSLTRLTHELRIRYGLTGQPLLTPHFHVSLHSLGVSMDVRQSTLRLATAVLHQIFERSFTVTFDRVVSFACQRPTHPIVLTESVENASLHQLHQALASALAPYDHSRRKKFTPHLTLLYDQRSVPEQQIEPISWVVREIVLVDSWVGQTKHVVHVRWPLRD